eukprot:1410324-Prymnesium_polylepis.2
MERIGEIHNAYMYMCMCEHGSPPLTSTDPSHPWTGGAISGQLELARRSSRPSAGEQRAHTEDALSTRPHAHAVSLSTRCNH